MKKRLEVTRVISANMMEQAYVSLSHMYTLEMLRDLWHEAEEQHMELDLNTVRFRQYEEDTPIKHVVLRLEAMTK